MSSSLNAVQSTFKRLLHEIEARNAIIDKLVYETRTHAYIEFRKAHPPRFACTHINCFECFATPSKLNKHILDRQWHEQV